MQKCVEALFTFVLPDVYKKDSLLLSCRKERFSANITSGNTLVDHKKSQ
jgi:hypothetical protein